MVNAKNDSKFSRMSAPKVAKVNVGKSHLKKNQPTAPSGTGMLGDLLAEVGIGGKATDNSSA